MFVSEEREVHEYVVFDFGAAITIILTISLISITTSTIFAILATAIAYIYI